MSYNPDFGTINGIRVGAAFSLHYTFQGFFSTAATLQGDISSEHIGPRFRGSTNRARIMQICIASWWLHPISIWKISVKLEIFANFRGENKKSLSCHHLDYILQWYTSKFTVRLFAISTLFKSAWINHCLQHVSIALRRRSTHRYANLAMYPISKAPVLSSSHFVPKKGGSPVNMTQAIAPKLQISQALV